jgi:putative membrane-bound dehydrogenase-like protein
MTGGKMTGRKMTGRKMTGGKIESGRLTKSEIWKEPAMFSKTTSILCGLIFFAVSTGHGGEVELNGHRFTLPDGFSIELAAATPLVERPICCDFDHRGRLYVAESSGSNANVKEQLEERPHSILRLVDEDNDGVYDKRTVFADKMMFPEGALWHDGSLYVAAPPEIWKLTDLDGDGVAEKREVWFNGQTLTGCANDLHGPYLGRDGWIYWCKGAFAEQTYLEGDKIPFVTRAAHIFRRHPDGGVIEAVMTGGMDNPVEVAFTPTGERIFTTTFLQHPGGGRRDGLVHAIYGGVYGKRHGVLEGHVRTGELLEPMVHLGAAAPCGLMCREGNEWGREYRHNLFACSFNMHKITRHELTEKGATFSTMDHDFLVSDQLDFHPTDVLEDGDGSLLVIDTGGWYKLCCPTSQLWKPDVLGAIYRISRDGISGADDPWGNTIDWQSLGPAELAKRLEDKRPKVRRQATERLRKSGDAGVAALAKIMESSSRDVRLNAIWTTGSMRGDAARAIARDGITDKDADVRKTALALTSLWRDSASSSKVIERLHKGAGQERRLAAETLGRTRRNGATNHLLNVARDVRGDRMLEHSLIYALVEIGNRPKTEAGLRDPKPASRRAAMIALDQMPGAKMQAAQVLPLLDAEDETVRSAALWIADHQPDWGDQIVPYLQTKLAEQERTEGQADVLVRFMTQYASNTNVQQTMAGVLVDGESPKSSVNLVLSAMAAIQLNATPANWYSSVAARVQSPDNAIVGAAISAGLAFTNGTRPEQWFEVFRQVVEESDLSDELRLQAAVVAARGDLAISKMAFALSGKFVMDTQPLELRSLAADVFAKGKFDDAQVREICALLPNVGPLEIERVLAALKSSRGPDVGELAIDQLKQCTAASSLPPERVRAAFAHFPKEVHVKADEWLKSVATNKEEQLAGLNDLLESLPEGDIRRGQKLFHGSKVSCFACHAMGYLGGNAGPDLTRIGRIRSDRDMLEAILYPSASFVRSYEPYQVVTVDGQIHVGILREDNALEVVLTNTERKNVRIARSEIDEMQRAQVSIMPAGLDKQLSKQQMADLLEFLRSTR